MEIIRVEYIVRPEYVEQNKANIQQVMADLKAMNVDGFKYISQLAEDGVTFMHYSMRSDELAASPLNGLASFDKFRAELKQSEPVQPPKATKFSLVDANFDTF